MDLLMTGSARKYAKKVLRTRPASLVAYWPLTDAVGAATIYDLKNGFAGTVGADMAFGYPGPSPAAKTAVNRSAANTTGGIALYSTGLRDAFNNQEMTLACWAQVSGAGIWADATNRGIFNFRADASNQVALLRTSTLNVVRGSYTAGGTASSANFTTSAPTDWLHLALTVSKAADEVKFYVNGSQAGATLTGLGVWAGALATGVCWIGGYSGLGYWSGSIGHAALWSAALTASEVAALAVPFDGAYRTFMAIGDSKTANTPNWPDYLTAGTPRIVHRPLRYATGGWTTQVVRDGIDAALAARSDTPDYVLVNLGANDVNTGDPGATWKTNTAYIADALHVKWPAAVVYLTKVWRRNTGLQAAGIAAINGYIDELVAEPARSSWLRVGINEANILEGGDDGATYTSDGVHPNAAGATLEAAAWRNVLGLV